MQTKAKSLRVNATLNAIKQLCGIIFPIITFSYATRVVGAEGIGVYSFAQSIISYMLLIASIGVTNYAVREGSKVKDNKDKLLSFCNEVYSINITFTVISYIVLLVMMLTWTRLQEYKIAILIQSSAIIVTTLGADWINTIYEDYLYLTLRYIAVQIIALLAMLTFVKSTDDLYKYIIICTLSSSGGNLFNIAYIRKRLRLRPTLKMNIREHMLPMLILFFNSIASVIYLNSDITMLRIFTDDREVGLYTVSTKVYSVIKTLINGVTYVTVPRFSYYLGKEMKKVYTEKFYKLFDLLLIITLPAALGLFMLSKNILIVFAGSGYESGQYVIKILSIAFPFAVGSCLYSYAVLIPNSLEKYFMISTIIAAVTNITLNMLFLPRYGMEGAAITTLLAEVIVFVISSYYSSKCIQREIHFRKYIVVSIGTIVVGVTCYVLSLLELSTSADTVISIIGSCILYIVILYAFRVPEVHELKLIIAHRLHINKQK